MRTQFPPGGFQSIFTLLHLHHEEASQAGLVGRSKTPLAEKFLHESLNTHSQNVQLVLRQRVARDGAVQESITREREVCDRRDEIGGEFGHHT